MPKRAAEKTEEEIEAEAKAARKAAKKAKKAAEAEAAAAAEAEEEDEEAAKAARKAAKKAKKAAEAAAAAAAEEEEEDEEAAKAARKAAKKAKKAAAAAAAAEEEEEEEAPAKKQKAAPAAEEEEEEEEQPKGKGKGKGKDGKGKGKGKENEVFIGGLPFSTTEDVLRKDFAECGEIVNFRMPLNDEGSCRGIAFCEYANKEGVEKALEFNGTDYGGRTLSVRMSGDDSKGKGKGKDGKGKDGKGKGNREFECFIGGLPWETTEEALKKDFEECGEIVNFRMPLNDEGKPRGIAFIEFKDQEAVDKALKFHETDYGGRTLTVKKSGEGKGEKGDKGKGKGKKGKKGKAPSEAKAKSSGCIIEGAGEKKTFDSDSE